MYQSNTLYILDLHNVTGQIYSIKINRINYFKEQKKNFCQIFFNSRDYFEVEDGTNSPKGRKNIVVGEWGEGVGRKNYLQVSKEM